MGCKNQTIPKYGILNDIKMINWTGSTEMTRNRSAPTAERLDSATLYTVITEK